MHRDHFFALLLFIAAIFESSAVNSASDYYPWLHSHPGVTFWSSICLTVLSAVAAVFVAWRGERNVGQEGSGVRKKLFWSIIAFALTSVALLIYYFWPNSYLNNSADRFGIDKGEISILGEQITGVRTVSRLDEFFHENALVLWIDREFFQLPWPGVKGHNVWTRMGDIPWDDPHANDTWKNDNWLRQHFSHRAGFEPPWGGIAILYERDTDGSTWRWIGYQRGHDRPCMYLNSVHIQEFKNGLIIGPVGEPANGDEGRVYILNRTDSRWTLKNSTQKAPPCERPN